jgi:hypothetical protein
LLDQYISYGGFAEFVMEFVEMHNEREKYELWLHKVWDKTYPQFLEMLNDEPQKEMTDEELETTISNSKKLLSSFVPGKG